MEGIILSLVIVHFVLVFFGYGFLAWKIKKLKDRLNYLYGMTGILPLIISGISLFANLPISTESMVNFLLLYFSGLTGGGIASGIITALFSPPKRRYKRRRIRR